MFKKNIQLLSKQFFVLFILLIAYGCAPLVNTSAWVIRYDIDTPAEIEKVCTVAKAADLDALVVQVRGRADAFYRSSIAPRGETLSEMPESFDPLQAVIDSCKGIAIHAWLNTYYLWSSDPLPENHDHPADPSQAWIIHDADGRSVQTYTELDRSLGWIEGSYADPASPEYRKLFGEIIQELVTKYPLAGIHLDFVRYPGYQYGHSGQLGSKFQETWGIDPRYLTKKLHIEEIRKWLEGSQEPADRIITTASILWNDLRAEQVTDLVRMTKEIAVLHGPPSFKISTAVFPDYLSAYFEKGQDWGFWADMGFVDALYPMTYFGEHVRVGRQLANLARIRNSGGPVQLWAGLGAYIKDADEIAREAVIARKLGYDGIALFSLGHLLRKRDQLQPYTNAVEKPAFQFFRPHGSDALAHQDVNNSSPRQNGRQKMLENTFDGTTTDYFISSARILAIVQERLTEFKRSKDLLRIALQQLENNQLTSPPWVELSGIFRFIHTLDSPERQAEQKQICEDVRQRMVAGENMKQLAQELSQGGSRYLAGKLGRRFLDTAISLDHILADLEQGSVSPVVEVDNGCWCYKVDEKGSDGEVLPISRQPWPVKRILFRQILAGLLNNS